MSKLLRHFLNGVFKEKQHIPDLYQMYIYEKLKAEKFHDTITQMFEKHIDLLRSKKEHLLSSKTDFDVVAYNESKKDDLLKFGLTEEKYKNIFTVSVRDDIEFYVLMKEESKMS